MSSSMSILRSSVPWIAILVPPYLLCANFLGYGVVSTSITTSLLVASTVAFTFSKQKHSILKESSVQEAPCVNSQLEEHSSQVKQIVSDQQPQNVDFGQVDEVFSVQNPRIENGVAQIHDLYSESESLGGPSFSSEDSDIDWPFSGELEQSPLCSDGSISDEESLIEIALPSGQFVKDSPNLSFHQQDQKVFADLVPESIFQQHYLVDFLTDISDVYEEDNLIEIDISMGSIKCSGYEIAA
ncbi:putative nudix hydrolase 2-like [Capsicum annuum]|uniref:uncharacterized protein LOC107878108 n=1 Tax=Capsicum annuum TaxID=4072 RepID=UPI001FB0542B|nr:uncharacterized protein LOC107878108 [Capsicum annuum]KAF3644595.1 putative nudix hydrolase 2-like [Capsicum annuum]